MFLWPKRSLQIIQMKTTSQGRRPQNIKSRISQQPLFRSYPNFKLKLMWPKQNLQIIQMKMTFHGRQPQNRKVEYLNNPCSDLSQILNFCLCDQSEVFKYLKWRRSPSEDNLTSIQSRISQWPLLRFKF